MREENFDIKTLQKEHFVSWLGLNVWAVVQRCEGTFEVYRQSPNSVFPSHEYFTKREAAARVLQCLQIGPVAPQSWPEETCLGSVYLELSEQSSPGATMDAAGSPTGRDPLIEDEARMKASNEARPIKPPEAANPTNDDLVGRARKFHREIVASDGAESPQMQMTRELCDRIAALTAEVERLRSDIHYHSDKCDALRSTITKQEGEVERLRETLAYVATILPAENFNTHTLIRSALTGDSK